MSEGPVRTTIVGGRPPAPGRQQQGIPRGIEVLVKKAAIDPAFRKLLLERRAEAAREIALELSPAEAAAINAVPPAQLEAIIANTNVPDVQRRAFLGQVGATMLAALSLGLAGCETTPTATPLPTNTPVVLGITQVVVRQTPTPTRPDDITRGISAVVTVRQTVMGIQVGPLPTPGERLAVTVESKSIYAATVTVRYDCPFVVGIIYASFVQRRDVPGATIAYQPQWFNVARGTGVVTFSASGSGGTTNWLVVQLYNNAGGCQSSPSASPPSEFKPGLYAEDACAIWKVIEFRKDWP